MGRVTAEQPANPPGADPPAREESQGPPGSDRAVRIGSAEDLVEHLAALLVPATVIVCIGSELRGDDAAGPAVARELGESVPWQVVDAQNAPENFLGKITRAAPQTVLLIDTLNFGAPPGTIAFVEPDSITGAGPSTHGPAPAAFLEALALMHPCRCAVLGIQPQRLDLAAPLSEPVADAVRRIVRAFQRLARSAGS